jgi:hypothetical protein
MSATRDKSSGIAFSNTNVYLLYKKAKHAQVHLNNHNNSKVLRVEDLVERGIKVTKFNPQSFKIEKKQELKQDVQPHSQTIEELKSNIEKLQDLHKRLRFMLSDLELILKTKK